MDDRIAGQDAAERSVREVQRGHRAELEARVGVQSPGGFEHSGRGVDAEDLRSEFAQERGGVPGPAAQVGDRSGGGLGERVQHRPPQRLFGELVGEVPGVVGGDGVVRARGPVVDHPRQASGAHRHRPEQHETPGP